MFHRTINLKSQSIKFRLVESSDVDFILALRISDKAKYLSPTSSSLVDQKKMDSII